MPHRRFASAVAQLAYGNNRKLLYLDIIHNGGDRPVSAATHADKHDDGMVEAASDEDGWLGVLNQQPLSPCPSWLDTMFQGRELALLENITSTSVSWQPPVGINPCWDGDRF
eukprot:Em0014g972a